MIPKIWIIGKYLKIPKRQTSGARRQQLYSEMRYFGFVSAMVRAASSIVFMSEIDGVH